MASGYKKNKTELIAIYRLEFYKKQKNWKFCHDVCKKPPDETEFPPLTVKPPDEKVVLNKTYSIELEPEGDEATALNNAFVETDSDKNPPQTPPDRDTAQDWPDGGAIYPSDIPEATWTVPEKQWMQEERWQTPMAGGQIWQDVGQVLREDGREAYFTEVPIEYNQKYECRDYDKGWPTQSQVWTNDATTPDAAFADGGLLEAREVDPAALLTEADCWLGNEQGDSLWPYTTREEESAESSRTFMLGAANAPHSSELDLRTRTPSSEADVCGAVVGDLSPRTLASRVQRHAAALRQLLMEARARDLASRTSHSIDPRPSANYSLEEYPTRDPGPALRRESTYSTDAFIAGSFRNFGGSEELAGKGRGRLRPRGRVIGIGMGRPYRL